MPSGLGWAALLVLVAAIAAAVITVRRYAIVGAGYKAKVLCTAHFVSRRPLDPVRADQVAADSYRVLRLFRAHVDGEARTVTTSLLGLSPRVAVYREGLGATLTAGRPVAACGSLLVRRGNADAGSWQKRDGSPELRRLVDAAFEEPVRSRLRRTQAIVVVQDGTIVAERYAPDVHAAMPLPGWSMAKSVLSALVGILVAQQRLALDDQELMPGWRAPDPRAAITVEDLLRMRSGLAFSEAYANPWSDVLHMLYNEHDTAAYAASRRQAAAPGSVWSYSSGTSNILSAIVRRIVGEDDYHRWPREVLFGPLGMPHAILEPDGAGTFVLSSYMVATAREWARYGQLWLDGGRVGGTALVPPEWVAFSTRPTPQSDGRYAAHWWLKLNPEIGGESPAARDISPDAFFAIGHEGQTLSIVPSKRLVVVRLGASIYINAWDQAAFIAAIQAAV